jgi:hypothetical protein
VLNSAELTVIHFEVMNVLSYLDLSDNVGIAILHKNKEKLETN